MTIEEIFNRIAAHMIEGTLYHDEFARAYDFLGLYGYAKCQDYHYLEEMQAYRHVSHYYEKHYFKLLAPASIARPAIIPQSWYKYTTQNVDNNTKKGAIQELMNKWINWEEETKRFYQEMRQELYNIGEVAAALYIDILVQDVDKELRHAQKKLIALETISYDLVTIMSEQEKLYKKYKRKLRW